MTKYRIVKVPFSSNVFPYKYIVQTRSWWGWKSEDYWYDMEDAMKHIKRLKSLEEPSVVAYEE